MPEPAETRFIGVVVAAGRSERFGGGVAKQFLDLGGRSLLQRSVAALADRPSCGGVIVVLAPEEVDGPRGTEAGNWPGVLAVVPGGESRAGSVRRGLDAADSAAYLLVHDAARPLVSARLVDDVFDATVRHGAAVPLLAIPDTVKRLDEAGGISETLDRTRLRQAQTPQGTRRDWLIAALDRAEREGVEVTDEAAALERAGRSVAPVDGDPGNFKITSADDMRRARRSVADSESGLRVGSGFDVHRVDASRRLVLGGVEFDGEPGLAGHSDADVVLHAAMDALLGAAGLGDIGAYFPPDDPQYAGANSADLAGRVADELDAAGYRVVNLDVTLLAERPKIRSRVGEMRESIGRCLRVDPGRVGLKATTLERLGALGREEGIACQAVALLRRRDDR